MLLETINTYSGQASLSSGVLVRSTPPVFKALALRTSTTEKPLASYLNHLPQIASLAASVTDDGCLHFDIHLNANVDPDTATNNIAQCVLKAGAKLYQLQVVPRNLDTVFREVSDNGD